MPLARAITPRAWANSRGRSLQAPMTGKQRYPLWTSNARPYRRCGAGVVEHLRRILMETKMNSALSDQITTSTIYATAPSAYPSFGAIHVQKAGQARTRSTQS